jgi:hypothetical protein
MINVRLAHLRIWSTLLAFYCAACSSAAACTIYGTGFPSNSIMFQHVPTDIRYYSSNIVEATISGYSRVGGSPGGPVVLVDARIDRVIKGSIDTSTVKILLHESSCGTYLFGGHGIIVGEIEYDPLHGPVLIPKAHPAKDPT